MLITAQGKARQAKSGPKTKYPKANRIYNTPELLIESGLAMH